MKLSASHKAVAQNMSGHEFRLKVLRFHTQLGGSQLETHTTEFSERSID